MPDNNPSGSGTMPLGDIYPKDLNVLKNLVEEAVAKFLSNNGEVGRAKIIAPEIPESSPGSLPPLLSLNPATSLPIELSTKRKLLIEAKSAIETDLERMASSARKAERELRADFQASLDSLKNWENLRNSIMRQNLENVLRDINRINYLESNHLSPEKFAAAVEEEISKPLTTSIRISIDDTPFEARARRKTLKRALVLETLIEGRDRVIFDLTKQLMEISDASDSRSVDHPEAERRLESALSGRDLHSALSFFDEDRDGVLSRLQFAEALKAVAPDLLDSEIDRLLLKCDPRGIGEFWIAKVVSILVRD